MTYNVEKPEHAWLNITQSDLNSIKNPLVDLTQKQKDNLHLYVLWLMKKPESCISNVYCVSWFWKILFVVCIRYFKMLVDS